MNIMDKLGDMTTNEFAKYLMLMASLYDEDKCPPNSKCDYTKKCVDCWIEWLEKEIGNK